MSINNISNPVRLYSSRVFFLLFVLVGINAQAQTYYYEINEEIVQAYQYAEELQLDKARAYCNFVKETQPGNLMIFHIENYSDFYECFITEEEAAYDRLVDNKTDRLNTLALGDKASPYYRFTRAEVLLQWALVELKFKKYVSALLDINKATNLLVENKKLFPDFQLNNKSLSVIHAIVGTIPDTYKKPLSWISSFDGTIAEGYQEISDITCAVNEHDLFFKEIYVIKALIELHLVNDKSAAWNTTSSELLDVKSTPLLQFVTSNIAHRTHDNDMAISMLEQREVENGSLPFYYLNYLEGTYRLNNLEENSAEELLTYTESFKGKNYIKEAYMKLAWHEYAIHNDVQGYYQYLEKCISEGEAITDEDKYALRFAKRDKLPNRWFLRARLLFDGRYYSRALVELNKAQGDLTADERAEYLYRKGRIHYELAQNELAISSFLAVLNQEQKSEDFYLSSLYFTALTYEQMGEKQLAVSHYNKVLKEKSGAYKTSLQQKSKAGIIRLK